MKQRLLDYYESKGCKSIQSVTDKQLVADLSLLFPSEFFFVSKQLTIKKMAALVLVDFIEPVCETCGGSVAHKFPWKPIQTTKERTTPYGAWARTCSASCNQKLIEKEGKRKQTFIDKFGTDNPMKHKDVSTRAIANRNTDWEKVGQEQSKRKILARGVDKEWVDSIDFSDPESKATALYIVGKELETKLGREPTREEIATHTKIQIVTIHRWFRESITYRDAFIQTQSVSSQQLQIRDFIMSLGFECELSNRSIIAPYEIDMVVESKKLGIEFHGVWAHSEKMGKDSKYHLTKTNMAEANGYNLLQIYDIEWMDESKREIWKSIIRVKLGVIQNKIYARQCEMKEVSQKDAHHFFEANHLQGNVMTESYVGLYKDGELVQCMSFGKSRFNSSTEVIRMATKMNTIVVGGVSRLFAFLKTKSDNITCFADRRYASVRCAYGNVLTFVGATDPNWYVFSKRDYRLQTRWTFMRHNVIKLLGDAYDHSKTAVENMFDAGYDRIWDSGSLKFVYNK